jgi:hypothetical protein
MQVFSLRAAVLAAAVAAPGAQASEALQLAKRLVVGSGLAVQLKAFPRQVDQDLEQAQGRMPDHLPNHMLEALRAAARESYSPVILEDDMVRAVAERLTVAEMRKALVWLDTETGRRLTRAEEMAAEKITPQLIQAYAEGMKRRPLSARRSELIAGLVESTRAVDSTLNIMESMALGIAVGMDSMQPAQKRIGVSGLRARLRESMPPDKLRAEIGVVTPAIYAYTYRDASDADLAAYLDFNRSSSGVRYNDAMLDALAEALARASVRVGAAVDSARHRRAA